MSRSAGLNQETAPIAGPHPAVVADTKRSGVKAREGKKLVGGYFSPCVRRGLHQMALDEETTIQALLGESLDLLRTSRGNPPFGEW